MLLKRKKMKKIYLIVAVFIFLVSGLFAYNIIVSERTTKDASKVMDTIYQVLETTTTKYNYSNIVTIKKNKELNNISLPFTQKSYIVKYNGIIKAGVKSEAVKVIKNNQNTIYVEISKCEIFDHYIDEKNVYVYDIKNSIFNKLTINEVFQDLNKHKLEYEKKAIAEGLMDEIKNNTKKAIEVMLKNMGYKEVIVTFKS